MPYTAPLEEMRFVLDTLVLMQLDYRDPQGDEIRCPRPCCAERTHPGGPDVSSCCEWNRILAERESAKSAEPENPSESLRTRTRRHYVCSPIQDQ